MKFLIPILAFITVFGCIDKTSVAENQDSQGTLIFTNDTTVDLYQATITLPAGWWFANDDTIIKVTDATSRYRFHNRAGKLVYLQYGLSTNGNPAEPQIISARCRQGYIRNKIDTSQVIFSDNPNLVKLRKRSEHVFNDTIIAGLKAILFEPKNANGYTGVYIDSIGQIATNIADLSLFAENLDSTERTELKKVIGTLKLQKFR